MSAYPLQHQLFLTFNHLNVTVTTAMSLSETMTCLCHFARYLSFISTLNLRHNGLLSPACHTSKCPEEFIVAQTKCTVILSFSMSLNELNVCKLDMNMLT